MGKTFYNIYVTTPNENGTETMVAGRTSRYNDAIIIANDRALKIKGAKVFVNKFEDLGTVYELNADSTDIKGIMLNKIKAWLDEYKTVIEGEHASDWEYEHCYEVMDLLGEIETHWSEITAESKPQGKPLKVINMFEHWFWNANGDVDVYNDVTDEQAMAFCGGIDLTDKAKYEYSVALNCDIEVNKDGDVTVMLDKLGAGWKKTWQEVCELFSAAAGYIPDDEYSELFKEWA